MTPHNNKIFPINKQSGPTSFAVVDAFRRAARTRKVGHTGTLDPMASGLLLLCTGRATRAVEQFMNLEKTYEFDIRLGVGTTTLDADGEVVDEVPCPDIPSQKLAEAARRFVGDYELDPPVYSALKRNGRRLYEMARAGEQPTVESRMVKIYAFEIAGVSLPNVRCSVRCSRGTYVRSLARDFGEQFKLPAHIVQLVRTAIGPFRVEDAYSSEKVFDGDLSDLRGIGLAEALEFLPGIVVRGNFKAALLDGALPGEGDVVRTIGPVSGEGALRILDEAGGLLAVGTRARRRPGAWVDSFRLLVDRRNPDEQ
jgi:tRNA pseudouridine55 synthase